jgi:hypothetical protein
MPRLRHNTRHAGDEAAHRNLWGAVVLQAKSDIETEPLESLEYAHAVAFFTSGGEWTQMRAIVGDFLQLHHDDIERFGRRCIEQRRSAEGLDPLPLHREPKKPEVRQHDAGGPAPTHAPVLPISTATGTGHSPRPKKRLNPFFPRGIYAT